MFFGFAIRSGLTESHVLWIHGLFGPPPVYLLPSRVHLCSQRVLLRTNQRESGIRTMHGNVVVSLTQRVRKRTNDPVVLALCNLAELLQQSLAGQAYRRCPECIRRYRLMLSKHPRKHHPIPEPTRLRKAYKRKPKAVDVSGDARPAPLARSAEPGDSKQA